MSSRAGRRTGAASRAVAAVLALVVATGCSGGGAEAGGDPATSDAGTTSTIPATPSVDANGFPLPTRPSCANDAGGDFVRATTSDGNGIGFLLLGTGTGGVVLAPEDGGDLCGWLPFAQHLAKRYRVAVFDWKSPREDVPGLAAKALRDAGAEAVVLGGASFGGALAMWEAYRVRPAPAGVVSLGGELTLPDFDGRAGVRRWRGPLLQLGSVDDDYFDAADAEELRKLHPGPETVVMLPGDTHGIALLDGDDRQRVTQEVDRFLARVLR